MILGIDHVGIAVADASAARETFVRLTEQGATEVETLTEQAVRVCFVPGGEATSLELLEPMGEGAAVGRFLARRGEGMHHVCYAVDDIRAEMARLAAAGFRLLDEIPRRGHGGLVAFLHPQSARGVLIELLQRDTADQGQEKPRGSVTSTVGQAHVVEAAGPSLRSGRQREAGSDVIPHGTAGELADDTGARGGVGE